MVYCCWKFDGGTLSTSGRIPVLNVSYLLMRLLFDRAAELTIYCEKPDAAIVLALSTSSAGLKARLEPTSDGP